jgi:hypothetical protein
MSHIAAFHYHVANPYFPYLNGLLELAAACDVTVDLFDAYPSPSNLPIPHFLRPRQLLSAAFLRRLDVVHAV